MTIPFLRIGFAKKEELPYWIRIKSMKIFGKVKRNSRNKKNKYPYWFCRKYPALLSILKVFCPTGKYDGIR
jgi:hypothetical protein